MSFSKHLSFAIAILAVALISACRNNNQPDSSIYSEPEIDTVVVKEFTPDSLVIYHITSLDCTVGLYTDKDEMEPKPNRIFFTSAAFTSPSGEIVGHAYSDRYIRNPKDENVTGGVIIDQYRGLPYHIPFHHKVTFLMGGYEAELEQRVKDGTVMTAFAQNMIIYLGIVQNTSWKQHAGMYDVHKYRALCETEDEDIVVVESLSPMAYDRFVDGLVNERICNAIYLDSGCYSRMWYTPYLEEGLNAVEDSTYRYDGINANRCSNGLVFFFLN